MSAETMPAIVQLALGALAMLIFWALVGVIIISLPEVRELMRVRRALDELPHEPPRERDIDRAD